MTRSDARSAGDLRPVSIETGIQRNPEGSVLYCSGGTKVLISASIESGVRDFLMGSKQGWITAEYAMHPRANQNRQRREGRRGQVSGRTQEIQRLIGRALRAAVRLRKLGERTITIDCDVLDADGGTRTASITGGFVALVMVLERLRKEGLIQPGVLREHIAAVSAGVVRDIPMLDLCYVEDYKAQVDLNMVATASGAIIEVQGTAEGAPIQRSEFDKLIDLGTKGISELIAYQNGVFQRLGIDTARLMEK